MGGVKVYIADDVEKRFRRMAMNIHGFGKGSISRAAEEAFMRWISETEQAIELIEIPEKPEEIIEGLLKGVNKTGVELQHEARLYRVAKVLRR